MTRRIYISGPVTGMPLRNVGEFERAAAALERAGYRASVPTRFVAANRSGIGGDALMGLAVFTLVIMALALDALAVR